MRLGFGFGVTVPLFRSAAVAALISSVNADGWSAEWAGGTPPTFTPDTNPQTISVTRGGYDATGAYSPSRHVDVLTFTRRKRQAYPNQATDTPTTVVLDDYLYPTDSIAGVTNNSTETSPVPVANWTMPHRTVVGNALALEVVAFHRNARAGRFVACVIFTATDGTTTVSQTVSATTLSARAGDQQPLPVFAATLDITGLTPGLITANATVYPWIGDAASVLRSADSSALRDFSPRFFLKNTGAKTLYYVKTTGNDTTGAGSTDPATASATPFATILGALNKAHTDLGATTGIDMAEIRVGDDGGTPFVLTSTAATRTQKIAAVTITRDPTVPRANARVSWGTAAFRPRLGGSLVSPITTGALRFTDVGVVRTGASAINGEAATRLEMFWENISLDNGGFGAWMASSDNHFHGVTVTNGGGGWLNNTNGETRIIRGVSADLVDGGWELWNVVANNLTRAGLASRRVKTAPHILFQNKFPDHSIASGIVTLFTDNAGETVTGAWTFQNLFELTRTGAGPTLRSSADGVTRGNTDHCGWGRNTVTGQGSAGRYNFFYDNNTDGDRRNHRRMWHQGDIATQLNTKGDVDITTAAAIGNFAYSHGVGCLGNWTQFSTNTSAFGVEQQVYPGLGSRIGTSTTTRNDPGFTDYRGLSAGGAGVGRGDYRLTPGAAGRGIVRTGVISHDLAGQPRPTTNDTPGAYA